MRPRSLFLLTLIVAMLGATAVAQAKPQPVNVMTRNVYLGADLTGGVTATNFQELVNAAGKILNEVDANRFGTRAIGLGKEIAENKPDLVGLQEVALWRTQPCDKFPLPPSATTVRYDFLDLLMKQINKGKTKYRVVVTKPEFDFEVWANTDGNEQTAGPGCPNGSEINGRLTMRDVIIAKRHRTVKTRNAKSGTYDTLMRVKPAGAVDVDVTRGWTAVDATVRGKKFRFVNVHFEAFDSTPSNLTNKNTTVGNGQIREAQAKELVGRGGPAAKGKLPVILVGDLNSDTTTEVKKDDGLAFRAVLGAGFKRMASKRPFTCCLNSSLITTTGGGKLSDFDHTVDHVLTNNTKRIKFVRSKVVGQQPVRGFWNSDHAGLFSALRFN
jgi:endonuclease/exonuclease/phosphatase family metal-dependent hydrolase